MALTQTCVTADSEAVLTAMTSTEAQAELEAALRAYANSELEAQAELIDMIKNFITKYFIPFLYVMIVLIGLNALNPWVTAFVRDWHRAYPGPCMYPNAFYPRPCAYPAGAAQVASSADDGDTWLDWMHDHGVNLSQAEGLALEDLFVQTLKEMDADPNCPQIQLPAGL